MKIKIEYSGNSECYMASTNYNGKYYVEASVKSFEVAKEKLIATIKIIIAAPKPEEVEI